ncbi:cytochrome c biogenesis protein [Opitutales bacterium]|jgi:HemX protein|nr:cytochrome c biogenesis protein [Opitutales bacterium]
MNVNDTRELLWLAGGLYGLAFAIGFLKTFKINWNPFRETPLAAISLGFILHTRALYIRGLDVHGCPLGNTLERIQFILWSLILAFLILRLLWRLDLLGSFCAGLSFCAGWLSLLFPQLDSNYWLSENYEKLFSSPWIELHASIAIFSYGLFSLLTIVCSMYLVQRKALLARKFNKLSSFLPPIQELEVAAMRLLTVGVLFLTISIIVGGMHWTRHPELVSHAKLSVTLVLWIGYFMVFVLHKTGKLYGSKFSKTSITLYFVTIGSLALVNTRTKETNTTPQSVITNPENSSNE